MKTFLFFVASLFVISTVFAQDLEKTFFENNPKVGGDVSIKSATLSVIGEEIHKTFEIESLEDGLYFMDAWLLVPLIEKGYPEYKVKINGLLSEATFKLQELQLAEFSINQCEQGSYFCQITKREK